MPPPIREDTNCAATFLCILDKRQNVLHQMWECMRLDEGLQQTVVVAHMVKLHVQKLAAVYGVIESWQILAVILDTKALQLERLSRWCSKLLSLRISRSWQLPSGHAECMNLRQGNTEKGREHLHIVQKMSLPETNG